MQNKLSFFSVFLFMISTPYLTFTYFFIPLLINNSKNSAYLFPLILFIISFVMILLLPKKFSKINYLQIIKKSYIAKACLGVFLLLMSLVNLFIAVRVVSELFYYKHHYIIFAIVLTAVGIFLSRNKITSLINASTVLLLGGFVMGILPNFITQGVKDITYLQPFEFIFSWENLLIGIFFILDTMLYCLILPYTKTPFKKKHFVLVFFIMFALFTLEIFNIIVLTGVNYLKESEFLGFFNFFIQDTITYVGNLGFIYLYLLPVIGLFKISYDLSLFSSIFKIKRTFFSDVILALIFIILIIFMYKFQIFEVLKILITISVFLLFVVFVFILLNRSDKYEIIF